MQMDDAFGRWRFVTERVVRAFGVVVVPPFSKDEILGRQFIDQAAKDGLAIAKRLQGADYDLDEVTPDSDNWKYAPLF